MPQDHIEKSALRSESQASPFGKENPGKQRRMGRVFRAGTRAATEYAVFWDVYLISDEYAPINMNIGDRFDTGRAVYPYVKNAAASVDLGLGVGDLVEVECLTGGGAAYATFERVAGAFDVHLHTSVPSRIVNAGGGGCGGEGLTPMGVWVD